MREPNLKLYSPKTEPKTEPNLQNYGPSKFSDNVFSSETTLTRDRSIDLDQTHLDENTIVGTSLNEGRAAAQTTADKWASGIYKGVTTFATATGETAGVVLGGIAAVGMTALGNEWDSDTVFKNPIVSYFADLNERIVELNPNYYSEAEHNASVLSNMGTANFWSDKVMNGIGFMASAMLTAYGAAGIGAKLGLKAVGSATKLSKLSISEGVNTLQAGIIGRMGESGIEANEAYETAISTLETARKEGTNNFTDTEIEEMAKDARAATFGFNMMLAIPDAYQFGKVFKTLKGQKVGRSIFGKSRVGHAAEQFILESQEENYQLAVSNTAIKMANAMADPETESGAGEYLGNIIGGMVDNFRTKEGQESMVLGGLLGGGMGAMFHSNDRTDNAISNIPEEILKRNNQIVGALNSNIDAEKIKATAIEKNDLVTAALIEDAQLTNMIYSAIVNNKVADLEANIEALSQASPEEFLTGYEIEVTEQEIKAQHQVIKQKIQQAKDRYASYPQTMPKAVKGNLFFIETAMDNIREQLIPASLLKGLVDIRLQNDIDAGIETDMDAAMSIGPEESVIPSVLIKELANLSENLKVLSEEATLLKSKGKKGVAARKEAVTREEKSTPEQKPVKKKESTETKPLGTIQKFGEEGVGLNYIKSVENDDRTITYTIRDDEGVEHTVNSKDGWRVSGVINKARGNRVERDQMYTKHEILDNYADYEGALNDLLENDPNWKDKIKIRVAIGKSGTLKSRLASFDNEGSTAENNIYKNKDINQNTLLIPSTTINFNITIQLADGREEIIGHIQDPNKFTDLSGNPIDLNSITDEEFYKDFIFTDGDLNQVKDSDKLEELRRQQSDAFEFYRAVETWFEGRPDGTELPAEFLDLYLHHKGYAAEANGQWKSPSEHKYLKNENGDYTIIDRETGYTSITNDETHADSLSTDEFVSLNENRYLIKVEHPTLGTRWVKVAPQTMSPDIKKKTTDLINKARLAPTKAQIDELNNLLYIAYQGEWNFKFSKANKKDGGVLRIDAFKSRGSKVNYRIPLTAKVTNLSQLVPIIKKGSKGKIELADHAFKNSIPLTRITTSQADKMFTVNVEPKIFKGVSLNFAFKTKEIKLESPHTPKENKTASVPVMITQQMRADLQDLGYTKVQIGRLTPTQARQLIHQKEKAPKDRKVPTKPLTEKEQIQKDINAKRKSKPADDSVFKKSKQKASQVINFSAAKQYLADKLPASITVEEMEKILDNLDELDYTWGKFADNVIYLSQRAGEGTQYHEAFHAVFRTLITEEERNRLYKISTSKIGRAKPIVHEESMADQFMKWKNDMSFKVSGPLRAIFNRIMNWGKWITGNETELETLFRRIDRGAFKNKIQDFSKLDTFAPAYKLLNGHEDFKMTVSKSEEIINTAAGYVVTNISGYLAETRQDVTTELVLEHMDTQAEMFNVDSASNQNLINDDPGLKKVWLAYEGIYLNETNRELVVAEVNKLLSMYGATSTEESIEETDEDEKPLRSWDLHQGEVGGFKNITKEIKQFIALAQYETFDEQLQRDIIRSVDFTTTYSALQRRLAGKSIPDMVHAFQEFAETDEQIAAVWEKFLETTGYNIETEHKTDIGLWIRFMNTFKLEFTDYIQSLKVSEDDKIKLQNLSANRASAEIIHFENWKRQSSNLNVFSEAKDRIRASVILNTASSAFDLENPSDQEIKDIVPVVIDSFKQLGIDLSIGFVRKSLREHYKPTSLNDVRVLTRDDITALASILRKGDSLYKEDLDTDTGELLDSTGGIGRLTSIASGDIQYRSDIFETSFQDAQNKTRWSFVKPSYILEKIRHLKALTPELLTELQNDPYFKYNPIVQAENAQEILNNLSTAFTGDFRDTTSNKEGVTFKTTNPRDLLLSWYALYNNGETKNKSSFYTPMIYEAKSTAISIQLPDKQWVAKKDINHGNYAGYFKGVLNKATIEHFIDTVFTQEHQRLNGKTGIEYIENADEDGVLTNPWVTLPFFNGVRYENKYITDYSIEEILENKDLKIFVANTIKDGLSKDMARHAQELYDFGIIDDETNDLGVEQEDLGQHIADFYLNDFSNSLAISQLLVGDLSQFKSQADHVKRMGGTIAYGTSFGEGNYKVVYKTEDEKELEGYKGKVNTDDAQVYTTVQRRMDQLDAHGDITNKQREIWEKVRDGRKVTAKEYKLIDGISMKTVHFDGNSYHKMSETYLSRAFVSDRVLKDGELIWVAKPERVKLHNMLEFMLANEVDSVVTMSASKMRKASASEGIKGPQVQTLSDAAFVTGDFVDFKPETYVGSLRNGDLRLQVVNNSGKRNIISGTQMAQLIDLGLKDKPELQKELYRLMAENRDDDFKFADRMLDNPEDIQHMAKKLLETLETTGGDAQMMEFLDLQPSDLGKEEFKYNLNLPHVVEKLESMFLAHLSKGTLQQKVPGYKLTLMSASGAQIIDKKTGKPRDLRMHKISKDGKTIELAEVMMTRGALGEILGPDAEFLSIEEINKELLKMVGTRIPTQAHHSMMPFEVVEFLPEDYKDNVIAPREIVVLSGADYDIDSLFVYRKNFYVDIDGEVVIYGEGTTLHEKYSEYVAYHSRENKTIKLALEKARIEDTDKLLTQEIQEAVFKEYGLISGFKAYKTNPVTTNGARNNRLVEIYLEVLTDPTIDDLFEPASLELLENASSVYFGGIKNKTATASLHYSVAGKFEAHKSVSTGKLNIGSIASANNVSAFFTKSKIELVEPLFFLGKAYEKYDVMEEDDIKVYYDIESKSWLVKQDDREDKSKINSLSTLVSGMTDDAKHGFAAMLNLEKYNLGVFANMISLGMGFNRTMLFASQPTLIELSKRINTSEESQADVLDDYYFELLGKLTDAQRETINEEEYESPKLTEQGLVDNLQKDNALLNLVVFQEFLVLEKAARPFQGVGTILGLNKGEVGNSYVELKQKLGKINLVLHPPKPVFKNLSAALYANENTNTNMNLIGDIEGRMRKWFIAGSLPYRKAEEELFRVSIVKTDDLKVVDRAIKSFLTAKGLQNLMQERDPNAKLSDFTGLLDPSVTTEKIEQTLAKTIEDLSSQEDEELRDAFNNNEFIKALRLNFNFIDGKFKNKSNKVRLDLIESNMRIKRSPLTVDRIMNGFLELMQNDPALGREFLRYAMVKDSVQFTNNSFLKFLDASLFKPLSKGLDNVVAEEQEYTEEFLKIFAAYTGTRDMIRTTSKENMSVIKIKGTTAKVKTVDDLMAQGIRQGLTDEALDDYVEGKLKTIATLPFIIRQYEGAVYYKIDPETYTILPPFGPTKTVLYNNKQALQQPWYQTLEENVSMFEKRVASVASSNAPAHTDQDIPPATEVPIDESSFNESLAYYTEAIEEQSQPEEQKPSTETDLESLSTDELEDRVRAIDPEYGIQEDFEEPDVIEDEEGNSVLAEPESERQQLINFLKQSINEKPKAIPEYTVDKTLKNSDGSKRLAHTDGTKITLNPVGSVEEFFDYFTGKEGGISSQQKQVVLQELASQGYPLARIEEILDNKKDINKFLILHEQDHIDNNDISVYWKAGKDLLTPDKVAIEVRASLVALQQIGEPVPWDNPPTSPGLFKPGAAPQGDNITPTGDDRLSKNSSMAELTSHNFNKLVKKLSKRFNIKVELVYQKDVNWLGKYQGGIVFLNTARLKSDTPFHEFAHPFVEAIRIKNKALYDSLTEQIVKEKKILARVQELYPELDYDGQIDEAITTAIGNYSADIINMPKTLVQKIKAFLKEVMNIIRGFFEGGTVILPAELHPQTTLRDLAAIMAKGDQVFELGELSDDAIKYSVQQATKLTVQEEHVDLVRTGDKTVSLREVRDDILYDVGDTLNIYANGKQQGMTVKLKHVQTLKTLSEKYREPFAKALGYENYKAFISEDAYAKEDSPLSMQFPGVYRFLQGKQPMQILNYEVIDEYETGAETKLEKEVKNIRQALIKQINHFQKKITEGNPRKEKVKAFVKKRRRLLKALDAIDDAKGMMEFIDVANDDVTASLTRVRNAIALIKDIKTISPEQRKHAMELIFKTQEIISAYSVIETLSESEITELLGEGETVNKFLETAKELKELRNLMDKSVVPLMASWLISFSNVDPKKAKAFFEAKIKRLEENTKNTWWSSVKSRERLIKDIKQKQSELILTQEALEDQLRLATRDIGFGSLWLEAAAQSSDHVTSLFSKALKRQEFEANVSDRITQLRLGVALKAFEKEQGKKGNRPEKFYADLFTEITDEETGVKSLVFKKNASTPAGETLLQELKSVYKESQDQLPEGVRLGEVLPFIRKSGADRMSENGIWATMKAEAKEIATPLATDDVYGYQTADGKPVKQVPIYYVFRGEGQREMKNSDISVDLVSSVLKFSQMANKYTAYQQIQGEVDLLQDLVQKRGVQEETSTGKSILDKVSEKVGLESFLTTDSNRVNDRLQEFINMQYYGKLEKPWIVPIGEKEIDINKLINFIGRWTGFSTLALNFLSAVNNVILGNFYMFQEAMARQHYGNMKLDLKKGYALYAKGAMPMFSDIGKLSGKSKETQLVELFDAMQGSFRDISGHFITGNMVKKLFNGSTLFFANHAGEHEMQVSTMFAAMAGTPIKLANGTETNLFEAYQLDSEGVVQIQEGAQIRGKDGEWRKWTETDRFDFQGKLHSTNKALHGNYNDFDRTVMQKGAIGRLVLMFRKFIAPGVRRRYGTLTYDNEADELHEGYFRTTIGLMVNEYTELGRWLTWKENSLTEYEKANVKKAIYEFGMFVTTVAMFAIATSMLGDDDDKNWGEAFALYQIRRFQTELSFYYDPMETLKIITSPAASVTTLKRSAKFLNQLKLTMMFNTEDTHYKTSGHGFKKGDSKLWASFKKLLPVIQGIERSLAPQEAIKYFDKLF